MEKALILLFALGLAAGGIPPPAARAHAFPERAEPKVGSTVRSSPSMVRVWFDGGLEPAFSRIRVTDTNHQAVDKGDGRVGEKDHTVLEASLPALLSGTYHVSWIAISFDGHRTEGDFSFTVETPP
ncbi:MAG: copper resistance protein CopC [Nitrospirota bacterium]